MAVATALVASCGSSAEAECQPVGAIYREVFQVPESLIGGASIEDGILTMVSDVPGAWYIVAEVDGSTPVWVTDRDPQGDELGGIITANRAAQRLSSLDFVDIPLSRSELAQAGGDPDRIAVAEACISGEVVGQTSL